MATISLLACQIDVPATPDASSRDAHADRVAGLLDEALTEERADLVVLPELSAIDYSRQAFEQLDVLAEDTGGATFRALKPVAEEHCCHILFGVPRRAETGYRISMSLIGPDGVPAGHYDKLHLAQYGASMEKEYFRPGDQLLVFDVGGVRVAPIICYDIRFPELCHTLCQHHGVDAILHCGAYFTDESYWSWHHFVVARALENQVYMLSLNRAGETWGGSVFCPPWVDETVPPDIFPKSETLRRFTLDTGLIEDVRRTYSFVADKKEDYGALRLVGP